jgi:hypothetical protein
VGELWATKKPVKIALGYVLCANILMTNQINRILWYLFHWLSI